MSICFHLYFLVGDDLSRSLKDLCNSCSVFTLRPSTLSFLLRVALIYSSVYTNYSSSLFKSLFCAYRTAICYYNASISAFKSPFLSIILELLNLTSSISFLIKYICSSLFLFFASKSYKLLVNSLFFPNSISLYLSNEFFSSFYLSNCLCNYTFSAYNL